ncbi:MAG: hypothetical protein EZS28_007441 [Streblomastix strix]|uniref:Uncharacterized protein n=1 Tax=Streblomastix strix TaxID=222440 RepID=A0A5J4WR23_9EUKA|nr:MAG: hypothetical protein EZS28_007441 [Streblomastix strix]
MRRRESNEYIEEIDEYEGDGYSTRLSLQNQSQIQTQEINLKLRPSSHMSNSSNYSTLTNHYLPFSPSKSVSPTLSQSHSGLTIRRRPDSRSSFQSLKSLKGKQTQISQLQQNFASNTYALRNSLNPALQVTMNMKQKVDQAAELKRKHDEEQETHISKQKRENEGLSVLIKETVGKESNKQQIEFEIQKFRERLKGGVRRINVPTITDATRVSLKGFRQLEYNSEDTAYLYLDEDQ